jgi:hypothetical protein
MEFSKIHKVGGILSPYTSIEGSGVQIPHALATILRDRVLNIFLLSNDGVHDMAPHTSSNAIRPVEGWTSTNFQNRRPISLGMPQVNCINPVRDITKCPLPSLEEIARDASIQLRDVVVRGI